MSAPHDAPEPVELIRAVEEFLVDQIIPASTGRIAFQAKVAKNILSLVVRQLTTEEANLQSHKERLRLFACKDDLEFALRIRSGDLDGQSDEVARVLREIVLDKVRVVKPEYPANLVPES